MIMGGLGEILRQKYDPDYKDDAKEEVNRKLSEIKAQALVQKMGDTKGKGKIRLEDLN